MSEAVDPKVAQNVAKMVNEADAVILLYEAGTQGRVKFKGIKGPIPFTVETCYGEDDDPPSTIRQVTVKAGWPRAKWRKMDRSALHCPPPNEDRTEGAK